MQKNTKTEAAQQADIQLEFAQLLGEQLDKIEFPSSPLRATGLSSTLGVAKTQAYKLLKGMAFPSLSNFLTLRKMGVSVDDMLDMMDKRDLETTDLYIGSQMVPAAIRYSKRDSGSQVMVISRKGSDALELKVVAPGAQAQTGAKPIDGLTFPRRVTLAIIEDNAAELMALKEGTSEAFRSVGFANAKSFFKQPVETFDLILMDWNLPDMSGLEVIEKIRSQSKAPIFIITGDDGATDDIVNAMSETIHHVAKPTNIKILNKRLTDAAKVRSAG